MRIAFNKKNNHSELLKDGKVIYKEKIYHKDKDLYAVETPPAEVIREVFSCHVKELPTPFHISGEFFPISSPRIDWTSLTKNAENTFLTVMLTIKLTEWNHPYTIIDFLNYFKSLEKNNIVENHITEDAYVYIETKINLTDDDSIEERCAWLSEFIDSMYLDALQVMNRQAIGKHILKVFEFPQEYQAICGQYLMWFGEFLEKFGINALISINNEGNETQVLVSSEHTEEMFAEIEALFSQYISLPYAEYLPANNTLSPEQQFMIVHLKSQVDNFKNQLEMKSAALELKSATIQSMQNTIDVQKNQLLLLESLQDNDELELFGGVIKIGEVEWGPVKFSPKNLLKHDK